MQIFELFKTKNKQAKSLFMALSFIRLACYSRSGSSLSALSYSSVWGEEWKWLTCNWKQQISAMAWAWLSLLTLLYADRWKCFTREVWATCKVASILLWAREMWCFGTVQKANVHPLCVFVQRGKRPFNLQHRELFCSVCVLSTGFCRNSRKDTRINFTTPFSCRNSLIPHKNSNVV